MENFLTTSIKFAICDSIFYNKTKEFYLEVIINRLEYSVQTKMEKNGSFTSNFNEKSMFFQTIISYGQNLQNQTKFVSIDREMFKDCEYNNLIILNVKY